MPQRSSSGTIRAHLFVSGTVQGVGYRFATLNVAKRLNLAGWVRNLPDGRVEAVFEGKQTTVEEAVQWCRQGSPSAKVRDVQIDYQPPEDLSDFQINYNN